MGKVTALIEREGKNRVARLDRGEINRHVRRAAAVRLDVCVIGAKQLACTLAGELLGGIHRKAARVPALARISFGVLVHEHASGSKTHCAGRGVFGSDEIDLGIFLLNLSLNRCPNLGILLCEEREIGKTLRALNLGAASDMAHSLIDFRCDKRSQHIVSGLGIGIIRADAEDVRTVVPAGHFGFLHRVAQSCANALETVRRHRHSHARTADENAKIGIALHHSHRHVVSVVGIVAGLGIEATVILAILE